MPQSSRRRPRTLLIVVVNLGLVTLVFGLAEGWLRWSAPVDRATLSGTYTTGGYFQPDSSLGYRPQRGVSVSSRKLVDDRVVYDVVYSIGDDGLRVAPPSDRDAPAVLFFGGSFTFGEGVGDSETLPFRVGARHHGRVRVHNFGFHGYGPHQMLAALESGVVAETVTQPVRTAVLVLLPGHDRRSAGLSTWDASGPRYTVDADGSATLAGTFADVTADTTPARHLSTLLGATRLGSTLLDALQRPARIEIMVAIIRTAARRLAEQQPDASFDVLLWDRLDPALAEHYRGALSSPTMRLHSIDAILRDAGLDDDAIALDPADGHPSALAHDAIAAYVVRELLGDPTADDRSEERDSVREQRVSVELRGDGSGRVRSSPAALDCPDQCVATFPPHAVIVLAALPDPDSVFVGWRGDPDCADGIVQSRLVQSDASTHCFARFVSLRDGVVSDLDGDGWSDLIWRRSGRRPITTWLLEAGTVRVATLAGAPPPWQLEGAGDIDGDGRTDLVWHDHRGGNVSVWSMHGMVLHEATTVGTVTTEWRLGSITDLDGDGDADLVWRSQTDGAVVVWWLEDRAIATTTQLPAVADPLWQLRASGDLDGDGSTDLVWQHTTTGECLLWRLRDGAFITGQPLPSRPTWSLAGAADFDRDGSVDLLWRDPTTGAVEVGLMHDGKETAVVRLGEVPLSWELVGPR